MQGRRSRDRIEDSKWSIKGLLDRIKRVVEHRVYSLTAVARPAAALSGASGHLAGGQQGRLAEPRKNVRPLSLQASDRSHLH